MSMKYIKKFLERVSGFLYFKLTNIRIGAIRVAHDDMKGAFNALSIIAKKYYGVPETTLWEAKYPGPETGDASDLASLFKKYGSDKSTRHNYYLIYENVLRGKRNEPIAIFEMGIGKPSASVEKSRASSQAFRDWAPKARIYGADIKNDLLFQEDRITTYFADQTNLDTLNALSSKITEKFDLIIDDGWHSPWANFNTIIFALPLLKENGVMVVEDINKSHLEFWPALIAALGPQYNCELVKMRYQTVCIISKKYLQ